MKKINAALISDADEEEEPASLKNCCGCCADLKIKAQRFVEKSLDKVQSIQLPDFDKMLADTQGALTALGGGNNPQDEPQEQDDDPNAVVEVD